MNRLRDNGLLRQFFKVRLEGEAPANIARTRSSWVRDRIGGHNERNNACRKAQPDNSPAIHRWGTDVSCQVKSRRDG